MRTLHLYCEASGCKKHFRDQSSLDNHIYKDHRSTDSTIQCDFRCQVCLKSLSTKQSLKEHMFTHSGEKPYKCVEPGCGLFFRQSSQLSNHKKVHVEIKKNTPELLNINLSVISKLFSQEDRFPYAIPSGPLSPADIFLPPISSTQHYNSLRVLNELFH